MRQVNKFIELITKIGLGIIFLVMLLGIYYAFYPKVKEREKYKEIYLSNERKIEDLTKKEKNLKQDIDLLKNDPKYAEQIAHEKGYARENETIFYFPANEEN